ncbi:hypothetical protein [Xenorhabdus innexi]|uniref:Uncharacterized protein n=1 Tax=Xenorhabdus innexi TaxID=290109 RepID=A0A1N6MQX9_9GAMM|nr:hypothetical protein [Xenorhabdus innexi]PHM35603.1 hypothetical protein Xinn_02291 [Xenorhabdus innexi]SIP71174.1 hypothetical protein XIS1_1080020 [Xenorhabdus innexi]
MDISKINFDSLRLDMDFPFLAIPNIPDPNVENKKITVTANIIDIYGNHLPNISIFISDATLGNLSKVKILSKDSEQQLPIVSVNGKEGFFIKSDNKGKVLFFIYPYQSIPIVLELYANVVGSDKFEPAKHTIFIVNKSLDSMVAKFDMPQIIGFFGEYLKSNGDSEFKVEVPGYEGGRQGDYILFFVNGKYTKYFARREQEGSLSIIHDLPYDIFTKGLYSNLFYIIVRYFGNVSEEKSNPLPLTYTGGVIYKPEENPASGRNYATCAVYDSYGVAQYHEIENHRAINSGSIEKTTHSPKGGLNIEVLGTTDPSQEPDKVPLDILVTVNMYLNSKNKNYTKSYSGKVKIHTIDNDSKVAAIIHIPYEDVVDVKQCSDGRYGHVYFDYTYYDDHKRYGKIWDADIDTEIY